MLFIIYSNLMCKLNPRKLDHDMQFYFFRLEVANFISAQYFLNIPTYGCTYFLYQLKHTYYFIFFLIFTSFQRICTYYIYLMTALTALTICNFFLLTYHNFENTHIFLRNVDVPWVGVSLQNKKVVRPDTLLFISLLVKVVFI